MPSWSLKSLREHIEECAEDKAYLNDLVNSMSDFTNIFEYHLYLARDSLSKFQGHDEEPEFRYLALIMGATDETADFHFAKLANQANTIAAIYTVRAMYDVFAQLVCGLFLRNAISKERCNIHLVCKTLDDGKLKSLIHEILVSDGFHYVNAFANFSKHHCLVKFGASINFEENRAGVRFEEFSYNGKTFGTKWSNDMLKLAVDVKNRINAAGNVVNELCLHKSGKRV